MHHRRKDQLTMQALIILRGLPGSGKSTLAKLLSEDKWPVLSIDDYFTDQKGGYHFKFEENHLAYRHCEERARDAMQKRTGKIFIDNTFTLEWEMEPYFRLASEHNYAVFVMTVEKRHAGSNIHGISGEQIRKMAEKYKVILL